ncbi:MAG TPA: cupin domain-containing protein [Gaiellaceae bacterium]|nr:cupin domain-containing protein [Gaiellaceae bacterium]
MSGYEILSLHEIEPVPYHAREGEKLLTVDRLLDYRAAGVNAWLGDPGERLVPEHSEDTDEELYVVVAGRATFTVDGTNLDAPAGTLVHVTAGENRTAVAEEPGTIVLAVGATPGEAHPASGWTSWVVADALRREGRVEDGRRAMAAMLERNPGSWQASYNVACYEALAGNADAAFEHLTQAVRIDAEAVRQLAAEDSDFETLRADPRWQEVAG